MKLQTILEPIQAEMESVEQLLTQAAETDVPELTAAILGLIKSGGKRIRPALAILATKFHPTPPDKAYQLATSTELLHVATLIHDDLIDQAPVRRGTATLTEHWSGTAAVLAGDYLMAKSGRVAADLENFRVFKLFSESVMIICRGEIRQDFSEVQARVDQERYFDHIYSKTGALFVACTKGGAILSGATEPEIQALEDYGRLLGLAFQVTDDTLDFSSTEAEFGKPVGSDLREGVITLPAIYFFQQDPQGPQAWHLLYENGSGPAHFEQVVELIRNSSAIEAAQREARRLASEAQAALQILPDNAYRRALSDLADFVVERKK